MERKFGNYLDSTLSKRQLIKVAGAATVAAGLESFPIPRSASKIEAQQPETTGFENGLALTPPLGWSSWYAFRKDVSQQLILETLQAMEDRGVTAAGYDTLWIDDGMLKPSRDHNGKLMPADSFPDIMGLANTVHRRGKKIGYYLDIGDWTCLQLAGTHGHEADDAYQTIHEWQGDGIKVDFCYTAGYNAAEVYKKFGDALLSLDRKALYSICVQGEQDPAFWAPKTGNMWRTTRDTDPPGWPALLSALYINDKLAWAAKPGHWNYADDIQAGVTHDDGKLALNHAEAASQFVLWAMMCSPLILGCDIRSIDDNTLKLLTNHEIIAVNQDPLGIQCQKSMNILGNEVYKKPLADGTIAVAAFNQTEKARTIHIPWEAIGEHQKWGAVRDLNEQTYDKSYADEYTTTIEPHGTKLIRVNFSRPVAEVPPYTIKRSNQKLAA